MFRFRHTVNVKPGSFFFEEVLVVMDLEDLPKELEEYPIKHDQDKTQTGKKGPVLSVLMALAHPQCLQMLM